MTDRQTDRYKTRARTRAGKASRGKNDCSRTNSAVDWLRGDEDGVIIGERATSAAAAAAAEIIAPLSAVTSTIDD